MVEDPAVMATARMDCAAANGVGAELQLPTVTSIRKKQLHGIRLLIKRNTSHNVDQYADKKRYLRCDWERRLLVVAATLASRQLRLPNFH